MNLLLTKSGQKQLSSIDEIPPFDGYLVDVWGVIYDGVTKTPLANVLLQKLKAQGKVALVSNTSRSSDELLSLLAEKGVDVQLLDGIFTSGSLSYQSIRKRLTECPHHTFIMVGTPGACEWLEEFSRNKTSSIKNCDFVIAANILSESDEQIETIVDEVIARELTVYSTNPDQLVNIGGNIKKAAGFFCQKVRERGGQVIEYGKPNKEIFDIALDGIAVNRLNGCMIGDSIQTDIAGGRAAFLQTILVSGCGGLQYGEQELSQGIHDFYLKLEA
ncbi:TIGR01459 family HAD-type hydrolase [Pantoea agglomerans]|uniref:TIGR01459 family HAD-type hydrolase n=1 Tax=Enterobacter agglomerans TaxID=549 RepID=UPI001A936345|nr:TIGR01459 family HAD-type hydrolase [Pantoea agglomerans]MBO0639858.1 TIGR01459 family HAD-type hydrolase [Pantoea agglomerans]